MPITNYNLDNMTGRSGNSLVNLIQFTSEQTNYIAGYVLYISFFLIIFLALKVKGSSTAGAFSASAFALFVVTVLMYPLHIVSGFLLGISIILLPISIFVLFISSN